MQREHENHLKDAEATRQYWNAFYTGHDIHEASPFFHVVQRAFSHDFLVVDVGCGSGRDAFSFATSGYEVCAFDQSETVISKNNDKIVSLASNDVQLSFEVIDLSDPVELQRFFARVRLQATVKKKYLLIYMRFLLHAIDESTQQILFDVLSQELVTGDGMAMEFRTIEDQFLNKTYQNHFRRFIDSEKLVDEMNIQHRMDVFHFVKGTGYSKYNDEDPYLAQLLMIKK